MKKTIVILFFFLAIPPHLIASDFLGVPVVQEGETIMKTEGRLEFKTDLSHNKALSFYREALKDYADIKFRDWDDATYIEDDGNRPWHSITISKDDAKGTMIVIVKDNWTWIIGTLVLRYIGVFVVLMVLFLGMSISGRIISGIVKKVDTKKAVS